MVPGREKHAASPGDQPPGHDTRPDPAGTGAARFLIDVARSHPPARDDAAAIASAAFRLAAENHGRPLFAADACVPGTRWPA